MPIDRNKEWTEEECHELFMSICNRYGLTGVGWQVKRKASPAVFGAIVGKTTGKVLRTRVSFAEWLFTGTLHYKKEIWLRRDVRPVDRLLTMLHEAAHAVGYAKRPNDFFRELPHGLEFQHDERLLCQQYGYSPKYTRNPGYAKRYLDTVSGETIVLLANKWKYVKENENV